MVFISNDPPHDKHIHRVEIASLSAESIPAVVKEWGSDFWLYGYASAIEFIAAEAMIQGLEVHPSCVVTTSDTLTELGKDRITRVFGCPVHSWYGSRELCGYLGGTLPGTTRYAINPLVVFTEVTDDFGIPVAPGVPGRLVLTHLGNYVFPFIRYDTGDHAVRSDSAELGGFTILESLEGRSSERLTVGKKILSAAHLGQQIVVRPGLADSIAGFQCAQIGDDALELRVVWASASVDESALIGALEPAVNPTTQISVKSVDRLETLPSGKRWVLWDQRSSCR